MENNIARVLAYQLAHVIDNEELDEVSGGQSQWTFEQTVKPSGSGHSLDVIYDVTSDW